MIRLCTETDRTNVLNYLYQNPSYNIFPIGDIEHFGFDSDFQHVYIEEDEHQQIISLLLRYREHGIFYTEKDVFNPAYLDIMKQHDLAYISGKTDIMKLVKPYLDNFDEKLEYFCATNKETVQVESINDPEIHLVQTTEDMGRLYDLLSLITEFGIFKKSKAEFIESKALSIQMGDTYFIEEDGQIVSTVAVTAETTINGMVVAVATHPDYRNRGYASRLMKRLLSRYLIEKEKDLCLFYDNPKAGAIYIRLGFEEIGMWSMFERRD
ncbi:GNAT family N-acetyltransferase [Candidatus Xianfuyuplasma coldseepsis]|uniref:GNAT family N-acetyltransferase n=1 Tax=Candidatus Xianfuyuplasma coldseepsis TaxID=2782163 RepID=A0A7L7KSU7_9MOLU|nr:GNAT family N-acetyltransferase [Xianfuyuplasma coldseepsis]QMS85890.1 GNAT family N-acetyltransferase [Xianfuyuplasma coldseepsis]